MFNSFRKKINAVIQESLNISDNINPTKSQLTQQNLVNQSGSTPSSPSLKLNVPFYINLYAGCNILEINENHWSELHTLNEENAKLAAETDFEIFGIRSQSEKLLINISDLNVSLVSLPSILQKLDGCAETIENIGKKCQIFEQKLTDLEDLLEVLELQEKQLDHKFEMALYKEKKLAALEKVREQLARKHADSVCEYEKKLRKSQQERQMVFQDAFQNDLKCFKEMGSIPKVEHKSMDKQMALEEVVLDDQDSKELDDFLNG